MFKKLFKLNALLLLLLCGYFTNAAAKATLSTKSCHQKHAVLSSAQSNTPTEQFANNTGIPVQISNVQRSKTVHYFQYATVKFNESVTYIRYLDFICGRYSSELSLFRRLILFPFHAFW